MDLIWSSIAFLAIAGIAVFGLIGVRPVNKIIAYLALNPEALAKVHRAIEDHWRDHDFGDDPDEIIEARSDEGTKQLVGQTFANIYRGQRFEVVAEKRFDPSVEWPKVKSIITEQNILVISVDLGKSIMGHHARMKAVNVRVRRNGVIKLDTRRPIKDAFEERYTPPLEAAAAAKPGAGKAPAKPTPPKRTLK